jgi:hypothetical protein
MHPHVDTTNQAHDERGVALLMALIFVSVIGVIISALLVLNGGVARASFSARKVQTREATTNGGLEWAINSLRQGRDGFCVNYFDQVLTIGGREVRIYCKGLEGTPGTNSMALYLNDVGNPRNEIETSGAVGADPIKNIVGPVYNGANAWDLSAPLYIDGEVSVPNVAGCPAGATAPIPLRLFPLYNSLRSCTTPISVVTPSSVPAPACTAVGCADPPPQVIGDCKIWDPGYYRTAPALAPNNYFKPGVYWFDLNQTWRINYAVRGGDPALATATQGAERVEGSIPRCPGAPLPPGAPDPRGVVFVFSRKTAINVTNNGRVELFTYRKPTGEILPNIVIGGWPGVTAWASGSTVPITRALVKVGVAQPEFIGHAGMFAPESTLEFKGSNNAIQKFSNTVVVARFDMFASASITNANFGIIVPSGASRFALIAVSCPGPLDGLTTNACTTTNPIPAPLEPPLCSVAAVKVYGDLNRTVWVDSYRVDREPGPQDPADCSPT